MNNSRVKKLDIFVVGFALFSMFFGAGNVIFPPYLGMQSGPEWVSGFIAYYIADILLAIAALFAILHEGNPERITNRIGRGAGVVLMTAIVLCIGPMLCIPRTAATTYEMAIQDIFPAVPAVVSSALFFLIVFALTVKQSSVIDIVGKVLTPALLIGLAIIIVKGIISPIGDIALTPQIDGVIVSGVQAGYQTMDVMGAMLFGIIIMTTVEQKGYNGKRKFGVVAGAAIVSGVLLLGVYMGLAYLGATVSTIYDGTIARADLVIAIVSALAGRTGIVLFGIIVALACLTTAIALVSSAASYFEKLSNGKVSYKVMVGIMCAAGLVVSNLGLDTIVSIAAPILGVVYPPTLVLIAISLVAPNTDNIISKGAVIGALITSILITLGDYGFQIPALSHLPFATLNLAWLTPAALCGVIAYVISLIRRKNTPAKRDDMIFLGK